jgi:hypothetical protein
MGVESSRNAEVLQMVTTYYGNWNIQMGIL